MVDWKQLALVIGVTLGAMWLNKTLGVDRLAA
jgi:hypothetical protein